MGACKSKKKENSHHAHKQVIKAEVPTVVKSDVKVETEKKVISPENPVVKSQPLPQTVVNVPSQPLIVPKTVTHSIRFVSGDSTWHEGIFQSDRPLSTIVNEFQNRLKGNDYDFYLVENGNKRDVTNLMREPLEKILPAQASSYKIELSYAGLELPKDCRAAYMESFHSIAAPKYDSMPFEIVLFNKNESLPTNHYFADESHKILNAFSNFSAYCNGANKIFFSGGELKNSEEYNNLFMEIDLTNLENVRRLPDLNQARSWHSMIFVPPHYVFIVGGKNTKSVELYDLQKNTITQDSNLNEFRGEAPLCLVNNSLLYVFGGFIYNDKHPKSFERCNLKKKNRVWEIVNLKNPDVFEPSFFSVAFGKGNSIILLGDRESMTTTNKSYCYMLNENGEDQLEPFDPLRAEDPYICSEKFFMPIDPNKSILLPLYNSEVVKLLIFDCSTDKGVLTMQKSEILETQEDEMRSSHAMNPKMGVQVDSQKILGQNSHVNPT